MAQSFQQAYAQLTGKTSQPQSSEATTPFQQAYQKVITQNTQKPTTTAPSLDVNKATNSGGLTVQNPQPSQAPGLLGNMQGIFKGVVGEVGSILHPQDSGQQQLQQKKLPQGLTLDYVPSKQDVQAKAVNTATQKTGQMLNNTFHGTLDQLQQVIKDPLGTNGWDSLKKNPAKVVTDYIDGVKKSFVSEQQQSTKLGQTLKNGTPSQAVGEGEKWLAGFFNFGLSPITGLFTASDKVPVLNTVSRLITLPFTAAGEGGVAVSNKVVDALPISQQAKTNIREGTNEIFSLASQLALGHVMEISPVKKAALVDKFGPKDAKTIIDKAQELAQEKTIQPGNYTPAELRNQVLQKKIEDTPHGKEIIKSTIQAEQTGHDIVVKTPNVSAFDNNIQEYRSFGGYTDGKPTENAALRDIEKLAGNPDVQEHTKQKVTDAIKSGEVPVNEDGTITLYRGGKPSGVNNLVSASYDKAIAESFSQKDGQLHEFKVKPEDIKAFIGKAEKEVLVQKDRVITEEKPKDTQSELPKTEKKYVRGGDLSIGNKGISESSLKNFETTGKSESIVTHSYESLKGGERLKKAYENYDNAKGTGVENVQKAKKELDDAYHEVVKNNPELQKHANSESHATEKPKEEPVTVKHYDKQGKEITQKYKKVLTTKEAGAVRDIINAKLQHLRETAADPNVFGKELDKLVSEVEDKSKGDKTVLSALRTQLNKEMYDMAGANGGNYKENYMTLQTVMKEDPEMGALLNKIDDHVRRIDETLLSTPDKNYQVPVKTDKKPVQKQQGNVSVTEPVGTGNPRQSAAYKRVVEHLAATDPELFDKIKDDPKLLYNTVNQKYDFENALKIVEEDPQKAYQIAKQMIPAPVNQRWESVNIALADRALKDKNISLWKDLEQSRSLAQTRAGQGIVAERGRFDDNSPHTYIQQVLDERLKRLGGNNPITAGIDTTKKFLGKTTMSQKEKAVIKIDEAVTKAQKFTRKERVKIDFAQKLLDELTCK